MRLIDKFDCWVSACMSLPYLWCKKKNKDLRSTASTPFLWVIVRRPPANERVEEWTPSSQIWFELALGLTKLFTPLGMGNKRWSPLCGYQPKNIWRRSWRVTIDLQNISPSIFKIERHGPNYRHVELMKGLSVNWRCVPDQELLRNYTPCLDSVA